MLRIVSLAPSNTEILYALGCEKNTIAVTKLCDYPAIAENTERIGTWTETDTEKLAALKPDLIITSYYLPKALHDYTGPGEIYHITPKSLQDVYDSILELGAFLDKTFEAQNLVSRMQQKIQKIKQCSQQHPKKVSVYAEEWWNPPMAGGNWVPEIMEAAGATTKFCAPGEPSRKVTNDEVMLYNPEIIMAHWCGRADRSDVEKIKSRKGWNHMQAVMHNNVFRIDDSLLNRPGPRLADGAEQVHSIIHEYVEKTSSFAKASEDSEKKQTVLHSSIV